MFIPDENLCRISLAEASLRDDCTLVLEGDYGGQIFLTCPMRLVKCNEAVVEQLLADLDDLWWEDPHGRMFYLVNLPEGFGIPGGMGGAPVTEELWCHHDFGEIGLRDAIRDVLTGETERILIPTTETLLQRAESDPNAMFYLAERLKEESLSESQDWCIRAAESGHLGAQESLAYNSEASIVQRFHWLKQIIKRPADERRTDRAVYTLALLYEEAGQSQSEEAALLERSCHSRYYAGAAIRLAKLYAAGLGVEKDKTKSLMWFLLGSSTDVRQPPYWRSIILPRERGDWITLEANIRNGMSEEESSRAVELALEFTHSEMRLNR